MTEQYYTNYPGMPAYENEVLTTTNSTSKTLVEEIKKYRTLYPEIHYKLEPFISVTCDAIEASGTMPTQEEIESITDNIFGEFCTVHPEMENYMKAESNDDDPPEAVPTISYGGFSRGFYRPRRRNFGRDLISILLLNRLARRWSPRYPFWY